MQSLYVYFKYVMHIIQFSLGEEIYFIHCKICRNIPLFFIVFLYILQFFHNLFSLSLWFLRYWFIFSLFSLIYYIFVFLPSLLIIFIGWVLLALKFLSASSF